MKSRFTPSGKQAASSIGSMLLLFILEGALTQFCGSVNNFGNNLFATNLGATDTQIGMVQTIPNVAALLLVLPLGILSGRLRFARTMPAAIVCALTAGYLLMSAVPFMAEMRIPVFFTALAFTAGGCSLYNTQWQDFFGEVVEIDKRNEILTARNRVMFLVGVAAPILCGSLMGMFSDADGKLQILQIFFFLCAAACAVQFIVFRKIPVQPRENAGEQAPHRKIGSVLRELAANRSFMLFLIPMVLFYMTWQIDWSMWYIGQVQFLELNETELSIASGVFNIGQFVFIGLFSRLVRKWGNDRTLCLAGAGFIICPFIMIFCARLPEGARFLPFVILLTLLNAPQCVVGLCSVQILLRVSPRESYSLTVSIYNMIITFTNCFMPLLGVRLYQALGPDNQQAFAHFYLIVAALRALTTLVLAARCRYLKKKGMLTV